MLIFGFILQILRVIFYEHLIANYFTGNGELLSHTK